MGHATLLGRRVGDHVPLWRRLRDLLAPLSAQARRPSRQRRRARALVPKYHLAPERPFPSAVDGAAADYRWLLGEGHRPERIVISGDSSAGGLTVAAMLKLREDGSPLPAGGVPISPWVDLACTGETLETNAAADLTATKASLQRMAGQYLQGADPRNPLASPLYADLSGLPPLLVVVGGAEALLDDSVRLARSAGMAGVDVTLYIGGGMQHIFPIYCGVIPESDAAVAMIGAWIRSRTSRENGEAAQNSKDAVSAPGQDSEEASPT